MLESESTSTTYVGFVFLYSCSEKTRLFENIFRKPYFGPIHGLKIQCFQLCQPESCIWSVGIMLNSSCSFVDVTETVNFSFQTKDFITKEAKGKSRKPLQVALTNFMLELKNHDYYADHFSRLTDRDDLRICDGRGWFHCEGSFDVTECSHLDHHINPYGNKEARILFSTWDLDHGLVFIPLYFTLNIDGKQRLFLPSLVLKAGVGTLISMKWILKKKGNSLHAYQ